MNGFDFDRLRDHLAPTPGRQERDAVRARAHRLRVRTRRNRLAMSSISVVAIAAVAVGIVASRRDDNGPGLIVEGGPPPTSTTVPVTTTTTPTTSTTAVAHRAAAISATWVSPDHGWTLQRNGTVAETTDGGATWTVVGNVGASAQDGRLRFADSSVGYAFDESDVFGTADGGRSWRLLDVPFHGAADLAIWNGTVYAASYDTSTTTVDVWTTSVGSSSWTKHPTGIPIGAGPVPETQLVLSGGAGWLLQVDRTVVGGAQLTASGDWTTWTPPCAAANGPEWLSASTAVDLVASCDEHTYGGGPIEASIWFSHDGGATFARRTAPEAGSVTTPKRRIGIVAGGDIERTTDEGATWHTDFEAGLLANDLGFTTATQGFIILSNGEMLMTYDAGATWQEVTLP